MNKKILLGICGSIFLLSSCSFFGYKLEKVSDIDSVSSKSVPEIATSNTGTIVEKSKKQVKSIENYTEAKIEARSQIQNEFIVSKNTLDNIITTCKFYEGKIDYVISDGKKEIKDNRKIIEDIKEGIMLDFDGTKAEKQQQIQYFDSLLSGKVEGKYKNFIDINNINVDLFQGDYQLLLDYLGLYLMSIKDDDIFERYKNVYLEQLKKYNNSVTEINENNIFPVLNAEIYHYKKCKEFIEKNFIQY